MRLVSRLGQERSAVSFRRALAPPLLVAALVALMPFTAPHGSVLGQEGSARTGDPERGEKLFGPTGCNGCHRVGAVGGQVGPELTDVFNLQLAEDRPGQIHSDIRDYVRESIEDPQAYIVPGFPQPSPMPSAEVFGLSNQDIEDLIAFLERAGAAGSN
jgi:cytochrome c2